MTVNTRNFKINSKLYITQSKILDASAVDADEVGFLATMFVKTTLPHTKPDDPTANYSRVSGLYSLEVQPCKEAGIPYGTYPRLILSWLTSQIIRRKTQVIEVSNSMSDIMITLGITPSGGGNGTIQQFKEQLKRLSACTFVIRNRNDKGELVDEVTLKLLEEDSTLCVLTEKKLFEGNQNPARKFVVSEEFFQQATKSSAPFDMRLLRALGKSPMSMDLYIWSTFRVSSIESPLPLQWKHLMGQFGCSYKDERSFRTNVKSSMALIKLVYTDLIYQITPAHFYLRASSPHIPQEKVPEKIFKARAREKMRLINRARLDPKQKKIPKNKKAFIGVAYDPIFGK